MGSTRFYTVLSRKFCRKKIRETPIFQRFSHFSLNAGDRNQSGRLICRVESEQAAGHYTEQQG